MRKYLGLRQQIATATSITEIDSLLKQCEEKDSASEKTKRAWISTAKRRVKELQTLPKETKAKKPAKKPAKKQVKKAKK